MEAVEEQMDRKECPCPLHKAPPQSRVAEYPPRRQLRRLRSSNFQTPRPKNVFVLYREDHDAYIRDTHPGISPQDVSRMAARWWKEASDKVREFYKAKYRQGLDGLN